MDNAEHDAHNVATHDGIRRAEVGGGIEIAYQTFGDRSDPPVLLVMGLATQMLGWPLGFVDALVERGHFVVRFDNRDIGLSTHLHHAPAPDVLATLGGDTSSASYSLSEMGADTSGLIDAIELDSAHVVGASMGGMIAQTLAIEHPDRVRSLTSIMSSTGHRSVGQASEAALRVLLAPPARSRHEAVERLVNTYRVIGSPGFEFDDAALRERGALSYDRGYDPAGVARQLLAIHASGDRTPSLGALRIPSLVLHGTEDPLVHVSGGLATAGAIPDARLVVIDGMGHDLPRQLWPLITGHIAELVERAEGPR